jgi:hypothetical protein
MRQKYLKCSMIVDSATSNTKDRSVMPDLIKLVVGFSWAIVDSHLVSVSKLVIDNRPFSTLSMLSGCHMLYLGMVTEKFAEF